MLKRDLDRNKKILTQNMNLLASEDGLSQLKGQISIDPDVVRQHTQSVTQIRASPVKPPRKKSFNERRTARLAEY